MFGAMADAAAMNGGVKAKEQPHRPENSSGLSGAEKGAEAEDSTQNGGRRERSRSDEKILLAAVEDGGSLGNGHRKSSGLAAHDQPLQHQLNERLGAALPRTPEDLPLKKNFQIPRKSKEKKDLFQKIKAGDREFDDIVNILQAAYLDSHSKESFTYNKASLVHSELLEKEFVEKRRELKQDGRTDKELADSYAFLMVDRTLVQSICENGLQVGHSKITVLGSPSMGTYLSRYADLLQANTLEPRATGDIIIFKVIKGKMKSICDTLGVKPDSTFKNVLDPTPKYECHYLRSANRITSILNYRAYERTQYYFYEYEYGFNEIRKRPRHVYPYAIVSFSYKDEKAQKYTTQSKLKSSSVDKMTDKTSYTLWKGQLLNRGTLVCHAALKSEACPLLPCNLPEKLDIEMVMSIEHLTQQISPKLLRKETYSGVKEEFRSGMYCSLYEVVEHISLGSNLEALLQKLEREKLVIVKPLSDRGYLLLLSLCQMASTYDNHSGRPRSLQALFLFRKPRSVASSIRSIEQKNTTTSKQQETHVVMPELTRFIQSLHYAYLHSRKDPKSDLNVVVEKYIHDYLKRYSKYKEFFLHPYKLALDERNRLYPAPKNKSHLDTCLRAYIFGSEAYQFPVSKAKKLIERNQKPQQFSPVSDYEAPEEDSNCTKRKAAKRNGSKCETVAAKRKPSPKEYDKERIKELIDLIQHKKKNVDKESDSEDSRSKSRLKRKLEDNTESLQKHKKISDSSASAYNERDKELFRTVIADFGEHDTDLRQQNVPDLSEGDTSLLWKLFSDSSLAEIVKYFAESSSRQPGEDNVILPQVKEEPEIPNTAYIESTQFKDPQSPVKLTIDGLCLPYSVDVPSSEANTDHMVNLKGTSTGSVNSFDGCSSSCPSTPIEQNYHRPHSSSNDVSDEMHWKLIPITGGAGRVPEEQLRKLGDNHTGLKSSGESLAYSPPKDAFENDPRVISRQSSSGHFGYSAFSDTERGRLEDGVYTGHNEKFEDQYELEMDLDSSDKHTISGIIEAVILKEYSLFTNKIQKILQQKNIMYASGTSRPALSAQKSILRLSEYICIQASEIPVEEYIERLSEKLNQVALLSCIQSAPLTCSPRPVDDEVTDSAFDLPSEEPMPAANDFEVGQFPEPLSIKVEGESSITEQNQSVISVTGKEQSPEKTNVEMKLSPDSNVSDSLQQPDKTCKPLDNTALAGFISKLKPEEFETIFRILQDVKKNTVKFYIHEEQENIICNEIKEYLTKLGNTGCAPELFLRRRAAMDKLLIIIQNEDIASLIHKIPCLVTLKRLSCVSFAGVDSLDDLKNRTYNELFVSGGFLVSDESVLNLESITVDKLDHFLKFLEELNTPDAKWQWKVHCKIQKKLKELGRTNANATSLLTLLNAYQKKHVVEIMSYHQCDSRTRNPPELDCLIRLQAQNIQQRHTVFLTEKNVSIFGSYADNGIVVTTVDNFMYNFKSLTEEDRLSPCIDHERQSVLVENDEKDEEDMSLDSGDEASHIEVCNDVSKYDSNLEAFQTETKGPHGTDSKQNLQTGTQQATEGYILLTEKTSKIAMRNVQPVIPVPTTCCTEGERTSAVEPVPLNNFQVYKRQLSMSHQFSHFNVLTHQTFLGAAYPITTTQNQESGNCFLSAYSQNMNTDQSSSTTKWDVSCDSSRPYSKPN